NDLEGGSPSAQLAEQDGNGGEESKSALSENPREEKDIEKLSPEDLPDAIMPPIHKSHGAISGSIWAQLRNGGVAGGCRRTIDDSYRMFVAGTHIFEPRSSAMVVWMVIVLVATLYTTVVTPVEIAWYSLATQWATSAFFLVSNIIVLGVFALDILVNLNSAFVDREGGRGLVFERRQIFAHYAAFWLWLDLVATLPFDAIFANHENVEVLRLLKLLRLTRIFKLVVSQRLLRVVESAYSVNYDYVNLCTFLIAVLLVMHIMGCCLFVAAGLAGDKYQFFVSNGIEDYNVGNQWLYGVYWAGMTVSTIGYGDVTLSNNFERGYAIVCMLVGASFYAWIVGIVIQIVINMGAQENERRQTIAEVNSIAAAAQLPHAETRRIRMFFSKKDMGVMSLERYRDCLSRMSRPQAALLVRHVVNWLPSVPWLMSKDAHFVMRFSGLLRDLSFAPHESVILRSDAATEMYIVKGGTVLMFGPGRLFARSRAFGEEILLPHRINYGYDVYTSSYLDCWTCDREEFLSLAKRYPSLRPKVRWASVGVAVRRRLGPFKVLEEEAGNCDALAPLTGNQPAFAHAHDAASAMATEALPAAHCDAALASERTGHTDHAAAPG
ncbi:unnamed protein product, partial [Phaeothamnion confervicola]